MNVIKQDAIIIGVAVLAAAALVWYVKKKGFPAVGAAVGRAAVDTAAGVVVGVGQGVGIPATDLTECEKAKLEGRTLDASFACPAGDFLSYVFGSKKPISVPNPTGWQSGYDLGG